MLGKRYNYFSRIYFQVIAGNGPWKYLMMFSLGYTILWEMDTLFGKVQQIFQMIILKKLMDTSILKIKNNKSTIQFVRVKIKR